MNSNLRSLIGYIKESGHIRSFCSCLPFLCAAFANIVLLLSSTFNESGDVGYVSGDDWGAPIVSPVFLSGWSGGLGSIRPEASCPNWKEKGSKKETIHIKCIPNLRWRWREIQKIIIIISNFPKKSQRNGSQQKQKAWRKAHPHSTDLKRKPDARDFGGWCSEAQDGAGTWDILGCLKVTGESLVSWCFLNRGWSKGSLNEGGKRGFMDL